MIPCGTSPKVVISLCKPPLDNLWYHVVPRSHQGGGLTKLMTTFEIRLDYVRLACVRIMGGCGTWWACEVPWILGGLDPQRARSLEIQILRSPKVVQSSRKPPPLIQFGTNPKVVHSSRKPPPLDSTKLVPLVPINRVSCNPSSLPIVSST